MDEFHGRSKDCKLLNVNCIKHHKNFVIRLDKPRGDTHYHIAYAFAPQSPRTLERFSDMKTEQIKIGSNASDFNGCPHCGTKIFNFCSCGTVFCADGVGLYTCPGCHKELDFRPRGDTFKVGSSSF